MAVVEAGESGSRLGHLAQAAGAGVSGRLERLPATAAATPPVGCRQELVGLPRAVLIARARARRPDADRAQVTPRSQPQATRSCWGTWIRSRCTQQLGDLHAVQRGSLAQVVGDHPQRQPVAARPVLADAADQHVVAAGRFAGRRDSRLRQGRPPRGRRARPPAARRASSAVSGRSVSIQTASECERQTGTRTQVALMPMLSSPRILWVSLTSLVSSKVSSPVEHVAVRQHVERDRVRVHRRLDIATPKHRLATARAAPPWPACRCRTRPGRWRS